MIPSSTSSIRQRADTLRSCSGSAKRRQSTWLPGLTTRKTRTKPVRPNGSGRSLGRASFCGGWPDRSPQRFDLDAQGGGFGGAHRGLIGQGALQLDQFFLDQLFRENDG